MDHTVTLERPPRYAQGGSPTGPPRREEEPLLQSVLAASRVYSTLGLPPHGRYVGRFKSQCHVSAPSRHPSLAPQHLTLGAP